MNTEERKRLRELCDKATPGPWRKVVCNKEDGWSCVMGEHEAVTDGVQTGEMNGDNADFIAAARNALPELLDEVERLRARVERLEKVREAAEKVDARIGHFHDAPSNDGMPMLSLIVFAAGALRSALAAALEGE